MAPVACAPRTIEIEKHSKAAEVRSSPLLGEHTEEVFRTVLGFDDKEIAAARQQGAI